MKQFFTYVKTDLISRLKSKKSKFKGVRYAFTLAEVLITLGIIGVVAAMTLPTLIQNHQKQTLVNQLKKVVNTLNNGMQMAVAQEEVSSFADTKGFLSIYSLYICDSNCSGAVQDFVKYFNLKYVSMDTSSLNYCIDVKNFDGSNFYSPDAFKHPVYTPDGAILYLSADFVVDVNGKKGPNQIGRDTFFLNLQGWGNKHLAGVVRDNVFDCGNESQYLERGCYYKKIVSDGWKMNY